MIRVKSKRPAGSVIDLPVYDQSADNEKNRNNKLEGNQPFSEQGA